MSLKIEINVPEDTVAVGGAEEYLANALSAIGYERHKPTYAEGVLAVANSIADRTWRAVATTDGGGPVNIGDVVRSMPNATEAVEAGAKDPEPAKPARRGRPPKTKPEPAPEPAAEAPQISTGEERVGPEDDIEEIDEETVAQDAADEQAEAEAKADPAKPLTHDDIRNLLGDYVRLYGMAAAQADGPVVIGELWAGKAKISDIPDTQEDLGRALTAFRQMMESNRFGRKAAG